VTADFAFLVGIAGRHRLEVGAGAEIAAGAGEHRDRRLGVGVERQKLYRTVFARWRHRRRYGNADD